MQLPMVEVQDLLVISQALALEILVVNSCHKDISLQDLLEIYHARAKGALAVVIFIIQISTEVEMHYQLMSYHFAAMEYQNVMIFCWTTLLYQPLVPPMIILMQEIPHAVYQ